MRLNLAIVMAVAFAGGAHAAPAKKATAKKVAVAEPAPIQPVYYDFKGARLGMTLAEVRALPLPTEKPYDAGSRYSTYGPSGLHCSNDPQIGTPRNFYLSDVEEALGVVRCQYGRKSTTKYLGDRFELGAINIGPRNTRDVEYHFLDEKLFKISITVKNEAMADALDGLTAKFGPPTKVVNDTTQNKAGATFPRTEQVWINPVATVTLESPYSRIDEMHVSYITTDGAARIVAKDRELRPAASKM